MPSALVMVQRMAMALEWCGSLRSTVKATRQTLDSAASPAGASIPATTTMMSMSFVIVSPKLNKLIYM